MEPSIPCAICGSRKLGTGTETAQHGSVPEPESQFQFGFGSVWSGLFTVPLLKEDLLGD